MPFFGRFRVIGTGFRVFMACGLDSMLEILELEVCDVHRFGFQGCDRTL